MSDPSNPDENFDRIEIGMTRAEVEAILGPPTDELPRGKFFLPPGSIIIDGDPIWESDGADLAQVRFDDCNRVKTKDWDEWPDDRGALRG